MTATTGKLRQRYRCQPRSVKSGMAMLMAGF